MIVCTESNARHKAALAAMSAWVSIGSAQGSTDRHVAAERPRVFVRSRVSPLRCFWVRHVWEAGADEPLAAKCEEPFHTVDLQGNQTLRISGHIRYSSSSSSSTRVCVCLHGRAWPSWLLYSASERVCVCVCVCVCVRACVRVCVHGDTTHIAVRREVGHPHVVLCTRVLLAFGPRQTR